MKRVSRRWLTKRLNMLSGQAAEIALACVIRDDGTEPIELDDTLQGFRILKATVPTDVRCSRCGECGHAAKTCEATAAQVAEWERVRGAPCCH